VLLKAHELNPGDPQLGLALGSAHEKRQAYEAAIRVYEQVIGAGGGSDFIVNNLAVLLLDVRTDEASYARALKLAGRFAAGPRHPFNLGVLGWAYYRNGQFGNAVQFLERAVAASPVEVTQLRYYLGMAYLKAGNAVRARQELQAAVANAAVTRTTFSGLAQAQEALRAVPAAK
jgi:Flp pilus assembly protein TadD